MVGKGVMIAIPLDRYEELLESEIRVKVAVERLVHSDCFDKEEVLWILDTEVSAELAQELYEERQKKREIYLEKVLKEE